MKKTLLEAARVALADGEPATVVAQLLVLADRHSTPAQRRYEIRRAKDWVPKATLGPRTIRGARILYLSVDREVGPFGGTIEVLQ